MSDGTILSWGCNETGQLGVPRCYLSKTDTKIETPQNVNFLNNHVSDSNGNPLTFGIFFIIL